jgi:putative transposase
MANTYTQMHIQAVFAVKYRKAMIAPEWKTELQGVIGNLINENECKTLIVNGVEDHMHCFFTLSPKIAISDLMKAVKAKSSKWINDNHLTEEKFAWQDGYGAFSYSRSHINNVYKYVERQEEHHKKQTFKEEYLDFLIKFEIDYDETYIFQDPI